MIIVMITSSSCIDGKNSNYWSKFSNDYAKILLIRYYIY